MNQTKEKYDAENRPYCQQMIKNLRHELHRCAELSMKEFRTKRILMNYLRENTSFEVVDMDSWFLCIIGKDKPGKPIAFRADMDALPIPETISLPYASEKDGVSHKCGHDGHSACLCGLALELMKKPVDRPVYLVFQPGEEIGAGGKACAEYLKKAGVSEVYAFHNLPGYPLNSIVIREGLTQPASEGLALRFIGQCSHASEPENGINPAETIAKTVLFAGTISAEPHDGMVLCTVTGMNAGTGDFGISAGEGALFLTLRAEHEDEMKALERKIIEFAETEATVKGLDFNFEIHDYFPETRNDADCLKKVRSAAELAGKELIEMKELWRASEDFGYYTKNMPGAIFYIGTGEKAPLLHTPEYDFQDEIIETAVEVMWNLAH